MPVRPSQPAVRVVGDQPTLFDPEPVTVAVSAALWAAFERVVHTGHATCDIYVGRDFAGRDDVGFGNVAEPRHGPTDTFGVLVRYYDWLWSPAGAAVRARLDELDGRTLGCWCAPRPCHGWILAAEAAGLGGELRDWIDELRRLRR